MLQFETPENSSYIKVIGVGGGGTNAVNHMFRKGIEGVDFIICNTDEKSLGASPILNKIKIGRDGLGAGNRPEVGRDAALGAEEEIKTMLRDNNTQMLFITAGMGGGTGTGAAPVIAKFAKEIKLRDEEDEILVVAIVTLPFAFEGKRRKAQAEEGINKLREFVDAIIIVNTDKIRNRGNLPVTQMFPMADDVLLTAAKGIAEIITDNSSYIITDFRDVQYVMAKSGVALMGTGTAFGSGEERALEAIKMATTSDLLNDCDIMGTKNILLNITTSSEAEFAMTMDEQMVIADYIKEATGGEPDIIWGLKFDESYKDRLDITLVATGFEQKDLYNHMGFSDVKATTIYPLTQDKPIEASVENKKEKQVAETIVTTPVTNIINEPELIVKEDLKTEIIEQPKETVTKHILEIEPAITQTKATVTNPTPLSIVEEVKQEVKLQQQTILNIVEEEPSQVFVPKAIIEEESTVSEPIKETINNPFYDKNKNPEQLVKERQARMEMFARKLREKGGVDELCNKPAYALYGMDVENSNHSESSDNSRISIQDGGISFNNQYLHDNPD